MLIIKSRVYNDPSEEDPLQDIKVDARILDDVTNTVQFDKQVIQTKATHTLSFSPSLTREAFLDARELDETVLVEANKHRLPNARQRLRAFKKKLNVTNIKNDREVESQMTEFKTIKAKFVPVSYFKSASDGETEKETISNDTRVKNARSLQDLNKSNEGGIFLTESAVQDSDWDWDCQLIDELSENTARWMVMKKIERDGQFFYYVSNIVRPVFWKICLFFRFYIKEKQKEKLVTLIEEKFGRYTRDLEDLDLVCSVING